MTDKWFMLDGLWYCYQCERKLKMHDQMRGTWEPIPDEGIACRNFSTCDGWKSSKDGRAPPEVRYARRGKGLF